MCGATRPARALEKPPWGLSPRVRGNLRAILASQIQRGPIPACAGQPWMSACLAGIEGAYPRVCGATPFLAILTKPHWGLSPRVRGNRSGGVSLPLRSWPIPACAGQPRCGATNKRTSRAYPRVCGATMTDPGLAHSCQGLSPRVRGNLRNPGHALGGERPIPACAGQPIAQKLLKMVFRAYPRVCGATPH